MFVKYICTEFNNDFTCRHYETVYNWGSLIGAILGVLLLLAVIAFVFAAAYRLSGISDCCADCGSNEGCPIHDEEDPVVTIAKRLDAELQREYPTDQYAMDVAIADLHDALENR